MVAVKLYLAFASDATTYLVIWTNKHNYMETKFEYTYNSKKKKMITKYILNLSVY